MSSFESKKDFALWTVKLQWGMWWKQDTFQWLIVGSLYIEKGEQQISFKGFQKGVGTLNAHLPALPELPPREAIGDVDNIEKDDTAEENINIEERGAYSISVGTTQSKETVFKINKI